MSLHGYRPFTDEGMLTDATRVLKQTDRRADRHPREYRTNAFVPMSAHAERMGPTAELAH